MAEFVVEVGVDLQQLREEELELQKVDLELLQQEDLRHRQPVDQVYLHIPPPSPSLPGFHLLDIVDFEIKFYWSLLKGL